MANLLIQGKLSIHLPIGQKKYVGEKRFEILPGAEPVGVYHSLTAHRVGKHKDQEQQQEGEDLWNLGGRSCNDFHTCALFN